MTALRTDIDPDGLLEYSVVYTDRSLNHMSQKFQHIMRDLSATLKQVYNADAVAIVPGSGTFAMEAVARQLTKTKRAWSSATASSASAGPKSLTWHACRNKKSC